MELMKMNNIEIAFDEHVLLQRVNLAVSAGDIIGIIGQNGAGKSTLLRVLTGDIVPTNGQIEWFQQADITHVLQEQKDSVMSAYTPMHKKWHIPEQSYETLSGGQQLKYRLVEGFLAQSAILLLDEPTNHLDEKSLQRLVKEVRMYNGTVIIVSHDRFFLDEVATKIWSLEDGTVFEQQGNYSHYQQVRKQRRQAQQREYDKQQKKVALIEGQLAQLTGWADKAHRDSTKQEGMKEYYRKSAQRMDNQVKSKRRRLEKELAEHEVTAVAPEHTVFFEFAAQPKQGKRLFSMNNVSKSYLQKEVLKNITCHILHGQRIALTGSNGAGKTTFIRVLLGQEAVTSGEVWQSPAASIGYLSQQVFDVPEHLTPAQIFDQQTFEARGAVQTLMHQLGFSAQQWQAPVEQMSMGERVKLKLMHYLLQGTDCLLLDEPTNHLDLPSREQFEETLRQYRGTIIVISHDRYFRERVTNEEWRLQAAKLQLPIAPSESDSEQKRLALETERQFVLGKLSMLTAKDAQYAELDARFNELTAQLKHLI